MNTYNPKSVKKYKVGQRVKEYDDYYGYDVFGTITEVTDKKITIQWLGLDKIEYSNPLPESIKNTKTKF